MAKLKKDSELKQVIDLFINNIQYGSDFVIAGNIYPLLTKEQLEIIVQKIKVIDLNTKLEPFILKPMSFFAKQDTKICKVYKEIVLSSPYLWCNGINKNESASQPNFIEFDKINNNIKWNKSELLRMYISLCNSFEELNNSRFFTRDNDSFFSNMYVSLLDEMYLFLVKNEKILETQANYNQLRTEINSSYTKRRGFTVINEALVSGDNSIVVNGVKLLMREIELYGWNIYTKSLNLLINRIIFKNKDAFLYCLSSIAYVLQHYSNEPVLENYIAELQLITNIYQDENVISDMRLNKAEVYYYMIKIAQYLQNKGVESEEVIFWLNLYKIRRFNNLSMKSI